MSLESNELNDRITEERGPYWVLVSVKPESDPGELDLLVETAVMDVETIKNLLVKTVRSL